MLRISQTPTDYIAIHAGVDSDHESVDFALVKVNTDFLTFLHDAMALAIHAKGRPNIGSSVESICFSGDVSWYVTDYDYNEQCDLHDHLCKNGWCYVEVDDQDGLTEPAYPYDGDRLHVDEHGVFKYTASGKYSGAQAWTSEVGYLEIIKTMEPAV